MKRFKKEQVVTEAFRQARDPESLERAMSIDSGPYQFSVPAKHFKDDPAFQVLSLHAGDLRKQEEAVIAEIARRFGSPDLCFYMTAAYQVGWNSSRPSSEEDEE